MKFCWYCMKEIPVDSKECSNCSLPQHEADD
jgi:predicted nucleic acid-binding Zn ribbon protein